jgi:chaperonin GroEL
VEEGIVPGGGTTLLHLGKKLEELKASLKDPEEVIGVDIVMRAVEAPLRQIAINAGQEGSVIVEKVKGQGFPVGYNALTGELQDLIQAGIIDPAKVVRSGLQDAASIAGHGAHHRSAGGRNSRTRAPGG